MTRVNVITVALLICLAGSVTSFNITAVLEPYSEFSLFNEWLTITGLVGEINSKTTITALVTTNTQFQNYLLSVNGYNSPKVVADALRYQILLSYFSIPQLQKIALNNYTEVATLLQATGRVIGSEGFVAIYSTNNTNAPYVVGHFPPDSYSNQTVIGNVTQSPLLGSSYSILQISDVLLALPSTGLASPTPAPTPGSSKSPSPSPSNSSSPIGSEGPGTTPTDDNNSAMVGKGITDPLFLVAMMFVSAIAIF